MNKVLANFLAVILVWSASAQGTLLFNNSALNGMLRIYAPDGVTGLSGNGPYLVDLVVGGTKNLIDATTKSELQPQTFFKSTANAGLFSGTSVIAPGISPGETSTATVTVRAWDTSTGATYDTATVRGSVSFTQIGFGGPSAGVPDVAHQFTAFTSFSIQPVTPEPGTCALAALGLGSLLFFRRK